MDPEERLIFEMLIADLLAHFINVPADQDGAEIQNAKRRVRHVPLASLRRFVPDISVQ
jgi:hypothetical protein